MKDEKTQDSQSEPDYKAKVEVWDFSTNTIEKEYRFLMAYRDATGKWEAVAGPWIKDEE